jgi:hypothetical protein
MMSQTLSLSDAPAGLSSPVASSAAGAMAHWRDAAIVLVLLIGGFAGSLLAQGQIDRRIYTRAAGEEVYFNADVPRVYENMTDRSSDHFRTKVHPLFLIVSYPPVVALNKLLHIELARAVQLTIACVAGLWLALFYCVLRVSGARMVDAIVFTLLLCSSGATIAWLAVPETYLFGSISLLVPLLLVAVSYHRKVGWKTFVAASAFSFSMTVTNWMAGIVAAFVSLPRRRAIRVTIYAFYAVVTVWGVQQAIFKDTPFFLDPSVERHVMLRPEWGGPANNLRSMLTHAMVLPEVGSMRLPGNPGAVDRGDYDILTLQLSAPGSATAFGKPAVGLWIALLVVGAIGLIVAQPQGRFRLLLGALVVGQLTLHTIYGEEAFLYALHYVPLLVLMAAWGARTRARPIVLGIACLLIGLAAYNNVRQFQFLSAAVAAHCDLPENDVIATERH